VEDPALLTGKGRFIDDIAIPGTLSAVFVRSPHAHATINSIDTRAARAAPGVHAVFTLDDLMPHLSSERTPLGQSVREIVGLASRGLRENITPFVLVRDEVCYVGDPIAVVVAESRPVAEDAAQRVEIAFDLLPAVADLRAALTPDAPPVHPRSEQHPGRIHHRLWRLRACVRAGRPPDHAVAQPAPRLRPSDRRPRRHCQSRSAGAEDHGVDLDAEPA
jgi:CO/xanthine dehydrogenase Mo-binding subunit